MFSDRYFIIAYCLVTESGAYLRINADGLVAFFAAISEDAFVALDAIRMFIPQDVALAGERFIALPAAEVAVVPILVHRLGVFAAENKLWTRESLN